MLPISEALRLGRQSSTCCPEHLRNLEHLGDLVQQYLAVKGVAKFEEVTTGHVLEIVREMQGKGYKPSYIRHAINALRLAANYMVDFHGAQPLNIEQRHLPPRYEQPKLWLSFSQLSRACQIAMDVEIRQRVDSTKSHPRPLELGRLIILTCGLCGLRLTEFCRLTPECLEGDRLTIGLGDIRTKNIPSKRVIPVPKIVADSMRAYWERHKPWSTDRTSNAKRVRDIFRLAHTVTRDDMYLEVDPKDLRKTLTNELLDDVPMQYLTAYCGWAFKGEMLRSYASLKPRPDDHPRIRDLAVNRLRERVTISIEEKISHLHF